MKPSDIIHNKVDQMIKRQQKTGHVANYSAGYDSKLLTAILDYLDEQAELHKEDIQITQGR